MTDVIDDLDYKDFNGRNALHDAVNTRNLERVRAIAESGKGAKLATEQDILGRTPLHLACTYDWFPRAIPILASFDGLNIKNSQDYTAFEELVRCCGNTQSINFLLKSGAELDVPSRRGRSTLGLLVSNQWRRLPKYMVEVKRVRNALERFGAHVECFDCWVDNNRPFRLECLVASKIQRIFSDKYGDDHPDFPQHLRSAGVPLEIAFAVSRHDKLDRWPKLSRASEEGPTPTGMLPYVSWNEN